MPPFLSRLRLILRILLISARTGTEVMGFVIPIVRIITRAIQELKNNHKGTGRE